MMFMIKETFSLKFPNVDQTTLVKYVDFVEYCVSPKKVEYGEIHHILPQSLFRN